MAWARDQRSETVCVTDLEPNRNLSFWVEVWTRLIGPILLTIVGIIGFIYELTTGHDATFGSLSLGLAAAGAGLSADILRRQA